MVKSKFVPFENVSFTDGFWKDRYLLNKNVSVENVKKRFEETGRFDALRFNFLKNGRRPHVFFDSDVAKWMEAVAYLYEKDPASMTENIALCEELIECMEKAQRPDGYLNSAHQQLTPETIFQKRNDHELYCAGHLIEAAVAYHIATGRDRFLKIMERYCDCIEKAFITEKTAEFTTPGHEEIELALIKLYRHTNNDKYLDMARFFLENRGKAANDLAYPEENKEYRQDDVDIYNLEYAKGHCVRALYYYCGIADLAAETGDRRLVRNLRSVFEDITERKMYVTGGVGSTYRSESFTSPYDLPNFSAYAESCAAIAMVFFAVRMRNQDMNARYGHTVERVLFNSALSSTSLDGRSFFYVNPLELDLEDYGRESAVSPKNREVLPIKERLEVFNCSCCPPNINRFFAELGSYLCLSENGHLTLEQYIPADITTELGILSVRGDYAGKGKITLSSENYMSDTLAVRLPEWCTELDATADGKDIPYKKADGYIYFTVGNRFEISLDFHIRPYFIATNPLVRANVGRVALARGPVVYCLEGVDNGDHLNRISVDPADVVKAVVGDSSFCGLPTVTLPAYRDDDKSGLYFAVDSDSQSVSGIVAKFIPYFAFANRGPNDMQVWVRRAVR